MKKPLYPLLLKPVYKDYIWGGDRIPRLFHRDVLPQDRYAESWEVADRPEGMSLVENGSSTGASLQELVQTMGPDLVGAAGSREVFPLLIKIIDARQTLSVQVHPDDESAAAFGGEAKTEMWYVLDGEPDSRIYIGLKPGTNADSFRRAIETTRVEEVLHSIPAVKGQVVFVPGGRVHAIGAGCLLLEIQQNSNTTYRVYDWGRVGHDGKPRELHVDQAMQVIHWEDSKPITPAPRPIESQGPNTYCDLIDTPYFRMLRSMIRERERVTNNGQSCHVLFVREGRVSVEANGITETLNTGTSCLLPAALSAYTLTPQDRQAEVVRISLA